MPDREKVIHGLESCNGDFSCEQCGYCVEGDCIGTVMKDALALLQEQEAVKPKWTSDGDDDWYPVCGACYRVIDCEDVFCRHCGRKVKWDD